MEEGKKKEKKKTTIIYRNVQKIFGQVYGPNPKPNPRFVNNIYRAIISFCQFQRFFFYSLDVRMNFHQIGQRCYYYYTILELIKLIYTCTIYTIQQVSNRIKHKIEFSRCSLNVIARHHDVVWRKLNVPMTPPKSR